MTRIRNSGLGLWASMRNPLLSGWRIVVRRFAMCSYWQIKPDILSAVLLFNHAVILLATQILSGNKVAPPSLLVILI